MVCEKQKASCRVQLVSDKALWQKICLINSDTQCLILYHHHLYVIAILYLAMNDRL